MRKVLKTIDQKEVLSYLQYQGDDVNIQKDIKEGIEAILQVATPRRVYKKYVLVNGQPQDCMFQLVGKDIQEVLVSSTHCILMAATLGNQVDVLLRKMQVKDMGKAFIYDACANAAIEQVMDDLQEEIAQKLKLENKFCGDRFSCGYGDLPIHLQGAFLKELNTQKQIGLSCNEASILLPNKSITALLGVSNQPQPALIKGCSACMLYAQCQRRKAGNPCVKE